VYDKLLKPRQSFRITLYFSLYSTQRDVALAKKHNSSIFLYFAERASQYIYFYINQLDALNN